MRHCTECAVDIEGSWIRCPLCASPLAAGETEPSPLPTVPLVFSRQRVLKVLFFTSLGVILASLAAQLLFAREDEGIGVWRSLWLGVTAMWLVVLTALRKRRNAAKGTVYLVLIVGLVCVYWDYLTGWHGWALTYAVPIMCATSIIALLITVAVMRMQVGDYIIYSGLTVLLGLAPILFAMLGWVTNPLVPVICGMISVAVLTLLQISGGREMRHELAKRLHL